MLFVNGMEVLQKHFPNQEIYLDFTPKAEEMEGREVFHNNKLPDPAKTLWVGMQFEGNDDLIGLMLLVGHLRDQGYQSLNLSMPYVPYSTMDHIDREKSRPLSLKYVAQFINQMGFDKVVAMETHSSVTDNMIDRIQVIDETLALFEKAKADQCVKQEDMLIVFPDEGAKKRYADQIDGRYVIFTKDRNFEDGKIKGSRCIDPLPQFTDDSVCIILDDLCRGGYTFEMAAKVLKERGCKNVVLCVTHLEKVAFAPGKVLREGSPVTTIYATDSCLPRFTKSESGKLNMERVGKYPFIGNM